MLNAGTRSSPLSRIDPRARILAALVLAVAVVVVDDPGILAMALAVAAALTGAAGIGTGAVLRRLAPVEGLLLLIAVLLPLTTPGEPLVSVLGMTASREGALAALAMLLRANTVLLLVMALIAPLPPRALADALRRLGVPAVLVHLLLLMGRYITVLEEEGGRLRTAMRARGFTARNGLHAWRGYGYLFGMLLVRGLERAERVSGAMKCRGFDGSLPPLPESRLRRSDGAFLALAAAVAVALFVAGRGSLG